MPRLRLALLAVASLLGCSSSREPGDASCGGAAHPTFRLTLRADAGALPDDTVVTVTFGGGQETWALAEPSAAPKSVFCRPAAPDAGADASADASADAGPTDAIVCDLWTSGAARVRVTASGFPTIDRELQAESDACGLVTSDVALTLEHAG